ncbi:MAG TPA: hypothetical protein VHH91_08855 [Vicinamibacterales bacterium]|nr:hypothetical protein [Vicinamibacterales bacterium]
MDRAPPAVRVVPGDGARPAPPTATARLRVIVTHQLPRRIRRCTRGIGTALLSTSPHRVVAPQTVGVVFLFDPALTAVPASRHGGG